MMFSTVTFILALAPVLTLYMSVFFFRTNARPRSFSIHTHSSMLLSALYTFLFIYLFPHWDPSNHIFFYQRSILCCRYEIFHKSNDIHLKRLCFVSHGQIGTTAATTAAANNRNICTRKSCDNHNEWTRMGITSWNKCVYYELTAVQ